ncbi:MAG: DNA replication/repair protein RecF [Chitinispirillales bacterium]|jgi:DNA replication and repair protein RecF|nr:DNA replication/repair protein RecF [Chitinispirillales bacterium]
MHLQNLTLQNFRNHTALSLSFPKEGALFEGANGAGKTNILEGINMLCTGRSQRGAARADMIAYGQEAAFISGDFRFDDSNGDDGGVIVQNAALGFSRDRKTVMKLDGENVGSYTEWFGERPAVSFGADDLELVYGAPEARRKFLDMLVSQTDRAYLSALLAYRRAMACRNALLGKTGDAAQFEVYEQAMAESAVRLVFSRVEAVRELSALTSGFYAEISGGAEAADVEYAPKVKCDSFDGLEWQSVYLVSLAERREKDVELMYTATGPHRDDLRFTLGGRAAKAHASQGQCRSFALSLKLASARFIEQRRGGGMVFLVDDAVSELDPERTSRVYPLLEGRGQVFIATPRCQAALGGRVMRCAVDSGNVSTW